jgi:hypothetical protein
MHVTRQRRRVSGVRTGLLSTRRSRIRVVAAGTAAFALAGGGIAYASTAAFGTDQVGQTTDQGEVLPSDQILQSIGDRLLVNDGKLVSSTVSPDGRHLAALTTDRAIARSR